MLQLLRGKKSGLFVKIALVLITIGFSFFGIESYFISNVNTGVAKVGDDEISQDQFRERFNEYRQRMMQMSNGTLDASFFANPNIKQQVLDQLINEQVLLGANKKLGVTISPARIREEILAIPAFQIDGQFNYDQYKAALAAQGMSQQGFEERVRQDIAGRELPAQVNVTALVTDAEVDAYVRLRDQRRDFRYMKIDKPKPDDSEVKSEEIEVYYKAHSTDFMIPERVSLDFIEIDATKLDVDLKPDDSALKDRYEKEKARFVSNEQRDAAHILIKVAGKGTPEEQKKALAKAEDLEAQIHAGKDFATLAKENSDDLGSKNQGGELGWLDKGTTDQPFEDALFAMQKAGDVSAPVLGSEGYHIIELRGIRPGKTLSFEEVKPDLAKEYTDSERERVYSEKAGRLTDLTYEDPSTLQSAAKELGLDVKKTSLISRQGGADGIAANPAVVKAAFSDSVLVQKNNSDPIELGPNHIVVVRVADHKAAEPMPLEMVRNSVRARILAERLQKQAHAHADSLLAALANGTSLDDLATANGAKVEEARGTGRSAANLDSKLVQAAFLMPRPASGKPGDKLVDLGDDSYALIELDSVVDGDPAALDPKTREAARNTLRQGVGQTAVQEFIAVLRQNSDVSVSADKLQDL